MNKSPAWGPDSCSFPAGAEETDANQAVPNTTSEYLLTQTSFPVYSMPVVNMPMMETSPRDLFPGALEMMILESLRRQPAHGYALVQHIQQRSNNVLQVEEGSLYPALQRLL